MNILVFGNGSLSVAQQERKLCEEFVNLGHVVYLVCNEKKRLFNVGFLPTHKDLHIIDIPFEQYSYNSLLIEDKIDVCLGMDQSVVHFVADYKNKTNVPSYCMFLDFPVHVIDPKDPWNYNFGYSQRFYYWLTCSLELNGVIFNNTVAVEEYYKRYKRDAHLVWYSISNDDFLENHTDDPTKDYIVGCNRLIKYKGTDFTMKALRNTDFNYKHLFVSGDPNHMKELESYASSVNGDVKFYEKISEDNKMLFIYNANLLVYPQITEWIGGLSIIEGMSVKTPGICFDYPVLRELYDDCAVYAKKKSISDLRSKIETLYNDKDMNKEYSEKGYDRFKKYFTRRKMAERLLKVISSI